jgi:hypothetical protein
MLLTLSQSNHPCGAILAQVLWPVWVKANQTIYHWQQQYNTG